MTFIVGPALLKYFYSFTRSKYSPVRLSILIRSPMLTKEGQGNSAPVSTLQGLVTLVAVLPFARLAILDSEHDVIRRGHADRLAVVQHDAAHHALLEIPPGVVHLLGRQFVLFKGLVFHEDELIGLMVEELGLDFVDFGGLERSRRSCRCGPGRCRGAGSAACIYRVPGPCPA